jgi:hypothetical protein
MHKRLFFAWLGVAVLHGADPASAQFTDPRTYENTPVGTNQLEFGYAFVRANASIDAALILPGAELNLNQGMIDYTRYFGWRDRLMWVEAAVPVAGLSGSIGGTNVHSATSGAGDSSFALAMLLKGGPALTQAQFEDYKPGTTLGVSFAVTAPTGSYDSARILNLGADRWSFKPEIALSHPFGPDQRWEFDAYANVYFYTDNTSYRGREILRQESLPGFEAHISRSLNDRFWASLDTRYSFRATTFVDGIDQNNPQQNFILGTELNAALGRQNSMVFEVGKSLVYRNGPALTGFSVKYDYTW